MHKKRLENEFSLEATILSTQNAEVMTFHFMQRFLN